MYRDLKGMTLIEGHVVARGYRDGNTGGLKVQIVTKVNDKGVYLDDSKVPIKVTNNLLVIHNPAHTWELFAGKKEGTVYELCPKPASLVLSDPVAERLSQRQIDSLIESTMAVLFEKLEEFLKE